MGENASRHLREHFTLAQAAEAYYDIISSASEGIAGNAAANPKRNQGHMPQAD